MRPTVLAARAAIRFYQYFLSPLIGPTCRFAPSCSEYALEAITRFGALRGAVAGAPAARCAAIPGAAAATTRYRRRTHHHHMDCGDCGRPAAGALTRRDSFRTFTMTDQRNLILAIVLSVGIIFAFQFIFPPAQKPATQTETEPDDGAAPGAAARDRDRHDGRHARGTRRPGAAERRRPASRRPSPAPRR